MGLVLEHISLTVKNERCLDDICLEFEPGARYVILGHTLAGKTSPLRAIAGLDRPGRGRIIAKGVDVTGKSVKKRNIAMVYQLFINYPSFTVFDNIASPLRSAGMARETIQQRVRQAAELLRIDHLRDRHPAELSGGQQQRTAIARALVKEADLLLLDEPLVTLDYKLREELREELKEIFGRRDAIVIYTTTEPSEALMLGGHSVVVHEGRGLQAGETSRGYRRPATAKVARIFNDPPVNILPARFDNGQGTVGDVAITPTGINVSDYPKLAQLWWQNVAEAVTGERIHRQALDRVLMRLQRAKIQGAFGPALNEKRDPRYWLDQPGSPKAKLACEKTKGRPLLMTFYSALGQGDG